MDEYRYLSLFLSVRDFISLTSCNKNLRRLYFEKGTIWKKFLERDFCYKYHPSYDVERYKVCLKRKNINISSYQSFITNEFSRLIYIDFHEKLLNLRKPLENWGLTFNNRPVFAGYIVFTLLFCECIFDQNCKSPEVPSLVSEFFAQSYSSRVVSSEGILNKYINKSYDLLNKVTEVICTFDPEITKHTETLPTLEFCRNHSDFNKAYLMWQELGF